jgi:hypothetical protein
MTTISILTLLWPALLMTAVFPIVFFILNHSGYGKRARGVGVIIGLIVLVLIYDVAVIRKMLSWGLTLVAFAASLALSVIAIELIVEET